MAIEHLIKNAWHRLYSIESESYERYSHKDYNFEMAELQFYMKHLGLSLQIYTEKYGIHNHIFDNVEDTLKQMKKYRREKDIGKCWFLAKRN